MVAQFFGLVFTGSDAGGYRRGDGNAGVEVDSGFERRNAAAVKDLAGKYLLDSAHESSPA